MQRHAFGFGNVVNANLLGGDEGSFPYTKVRNGRKVASNFEEAKKYREIIKEHFNTVTFESELRPHVWLKQMGKSADGKKLRKVF
ncbi:MAG: glycoside hydrolase, partial [Mariniblastus sp.]